MTRRSTGRLSGAPPLSTSGGGDTGLGCRPPAQGDTAIGARKVSFRRSARDLGSAADRFVGLAPRGGPAVTLDLDSADMFVGLAPRGGPAVTLDLGQRGGHVRRPHH